MPINQSIFTSAAKNCLMSPDDAADVIIAALVEPAAVPLACADLLIYSYNVLYRLWRAQEQSTASDLHHTLRRYRNVLHCTMQFVCAFRSAEQFQLLEHIFEPGRCICAEGPQVLYTCISPQHHATLLSAGSRKLECLLLSIDILLQEVIERQGGLHKLYRTIHKNTWPVGMGDLVPAGPASVYNLTRLTCLVFAAMPNYSKAGFLKSPILVDWLHGTATTGITLPFDTDAKAPSDVIEITGAVLESIRSLSDSELVQWLTSSCYHSIQDVCTALDHARSALAAYSPASPSYRLAMDLDTIYVRAIIRLVRASEPDLYVGCIVPGSEADEKLRRYRTDPIFKLANAALVPNRRHRCDGPGCIATYADRSKRFKRCGGCQITVYCSPQCQAAAWRHRGAAHRELCGLVQMCGAVLTEGMDINDAAAKAWGSVPREQLDMACTNIKNLQATQLARLKEEMDSFRTDD